MLDRYQSALLAGLMTLACTAQAQAVVPVETIGIAAEQASALNANKPALRWQLDQGVPVHTQLQAWAERGGWTLDWQPKVTWLVAGQVDFEGSFEEVLTEVIESLFFEGKPIRLVLWQGNRLAEVIPSDIR